MGGRAFRAPSTYEYFYTDGGVDAGPSRAASAPASSCSPRPCTPASSSTRTSSAATGRSSDRSTEPTPRTSSNRCRCRRHHHDRTTRSSRIRNGSMASSTTEQLDPDPDRGYRRRSPQGVARRHDVRGDVRLPLRAILDASRGRSESRRAERAAAVRVVSRRDPAGAEPRQRRPADHVRRRAPDRARRTTARVRVP